MPTVAKWGLFEHTFRSSVGYSNPLQQARLSVVFTSPQGEKQEVEGFWDGGRSWRVRFVPNESGVWSFTSNCSDADNKGLNAQSGDLVCTAAGTAGRFSEHGAVSVARDHHHLEHADGTPFFWLADTVWNGPRLATAEDWVLYAGVRADQKFTVALWSPGGGAGAPGEAALSRSAGHLAVNPDAFQKMDARLDTLSHAGILSAIAPLMGPVAENLSEEETVAWLHYVVARWGAEPVVWVLSLDNQASAESIARLKRIGAAVFGQMAHAPVMLAVNGKAELPGEMRAERWVDVLGFEALDGHLANRDGDDWKKDPERPVIFSTPVENEVEAQGGKRFQANDVRQSAYWDLLVVPTAGVSYGARGVVEWNSTVSASGAGASLPMWHRSLFLSGAKQMSLLTEFFQAHEYWRLRPLPKLIVSHPDNAQRAGKTVAAGTEAKDLVVAYVAPGGSLELLVEGLPSSPVVSWFNPRTGKSSPAVAVVTGSSCQFPSPEPGDEVLVAKRGSR